MIPIETKHYNLLKRAMKIIEIIQKIEKAKEQWRYFADEIIPNDSISFDSVNNELDLLNAKIRKGWVLCNEVKRQINAL